MSLRSDIVYAWRQINKSRATSAAAVLSLGLAIGACTSAFQLIDALLLRPLPVAHPERLYLKGRHFQIVGLAGDARYRDMRETIWPTAYVPFRRLDQTGGLLARNRGTFIVRTKGPDPLSLASALRREVARVPGAGLHVSNVRTQVDLDAQHTLRERLLAALALFFAGVALLLAGVGLYGVLAYSVLQRRREIGIRMALGAPAGDIARRVTVEAFAMVLAGAIAGFGAGMFAARYLELLLYQVKATDAGMLAMPALAMAAAALLTAAPAVIRVVRIDPAAVMRAE